MAIQSSSCRGWLQHFKVAVWLRLYVPSLLASSLVPTTMRRAGLVAKWLATTLRLRRVREKLLASRSNTVALCKRSMDAGPWRRVPAVRMTMRRKKLGPAATTR